MMTSSTLALLLCYVTVTSSLRLNAAQFGYRTEDDEYIFPDRESGQTIRTVFGMDDDTPVKQVIPFKLTEKMVEEQKLENCETDMSSCAYSVNELIEKIFEHENINPDVEEAFLGKPDKITPIEPGIDAVRPEGGKSLSCKQACNRHAVTRRYVVNCRGLLFDKKTTHLYMRKINMIRCYRCRANCNTGSVFS